MGYVHKDAKPATEGKVSTNESNFPTPMLVRAWFTVQVFPMPPTCERQINTAMTWFLWRGGIFRLPLSTLQRRKLQGGWDLINVDAKSRALLHFRLQTQSTVPGTFMANWFWKWKLQTPGPTRPRSNGYRLTLSTCASSRWMEPRLRYPATEV